MAHATAWLRGLGIAGLGLAVAGATVWGALAIYYSDLPGEPLRVGLAAALVLGTPRGIPAAAQSPPDVARLRRRVRDPAALVEPARAAKSNDRDWQEDVAPNPPPTGEVHGDRPHPAQRAQLRLSLRDRTSRRAGKTRTYDLSQLRGVDLFLSSIGAHRRSPTPS